MKKVVVDGATSFIAGHLIEKLASLNCKIYAIVRKNSIKKQKLEKLKNVNIIELDMEDIIKLPNYISEKCDTFYHFAWNGTRGIDRDNKELQEKNIKMSLNALKVAQKLGCKTFFTAGSQAEYKKTLQKVTENCECEPSMEYGKAKLKFYLEAKKYCDKENIRLFEPRIFSVYGKGDNEKTLIMYTLNNFLNNKDVEMSSGLQLWNYIYVKDVVEILIKLDDSKIAGGIFNIASDDTRKLKDFIIEIKEALKSKSQIIFTDKISDGINPDITKLINELNYKFKYKFIDGIKDMLD